MWNREDFKKWVRAVGCAESYLRARVWEVLRICCRSSKGAIWHCTVKNLCFVLHQVTFQTQYVTSKKKSKRWCMSCLILKKLHSIPFSSILSSAEILDFSLALKIVDPLKKYLQCIINSGVCTCQLSAAQEHDYAFIPHLHQLAHRVCCSVLFSFVGSVLAA